MTVIGKMRKAAMDRADMPMHSDSSAEGFELLQSTVSNLLKFV